MNVETDADSFTYLRSRHRTLWHLTLLADQLSGLVSNHNFLHSDFYHCSVCANIDLRGAGGSGDNQRRNICMETRVSTRLCSQLKTSRVYIEDGISCSTLHRSLSDTVTMTLLHADPFTIQRRGLQSWTSYLSNLVGMVFFVLCSFPH